MSSSQESAFDQELVDIFMEEAGEILIQLEEDLLQLEEEPQNKEIIDRIFRSAHTLKGSAGLTGIYPISTFAHTLEDVLDRFRQDNAAIPESHMIVLLDSLDLLKKIVTSLTEGGMDDLVERSEEIQELLNFMVDLSSAEDQEGDQESKFTAKNRYRVKLSFDPYLFQRGTDPLLLLDELREKGEILKVNISIADLPSIEELDPTLIYLKWVVELDSEEDKSAIEEIFIFVEDAIEIEEINIEEDLHNRADKKMGEMAVEEGLVQPQDVDSAVESQKKLGNILVEEGKVAPKQMENLAKQQQEARESREVSTIRVDTQKLEQIMDQVAELAIAQSRIKNLIEENLNGASDEANHVFEEINKITRNLQEEVMRTSMVPIGNTFVRFQRMVRDLAKEKEKEIDLIISGKDTELDRKVIEQITDPLKHMIRNSVDHGIEKPEERVKKGKDSTGKIYLKAYYREGGIIIEVSDDGKGLDPEIILQKAREKGLVNSDEHLNKEEILQLPFRAGFSTAEEVSDTSGRGVGLDVVYNNITSLRGNVELDSEKGIGTRFMIRLPLTLAIIDAIMLRIGDNRVLVPITSVIEFIKLSSSNVKSITGKTPVISFRGDYVPLLNLANILGLNANSQTVDEGMIVIVQDQRRRVALLVDEVMGQEQVVVKSVKENYGHVEGVEGATILGDGRVAMILDIPSTTKLGLSR